MPTELTTTEAKPDLPQQENHIRGFLHGAGLAAASLVFNGVLTLATAMVLARWLRPAAFGTYSIALVAITLLGGLGAAGMDTTVARFVAFYSGSGEDDLIKPILRFGIRWATIMSMVLATACYLWLNVGSALPAKLSPLRPLALYICVGTPLFALSLVLLQAVLHLGAIKTRMVIEKAIQPLLRLVVPFAAVLLLHNRLLAAVSGILLASLFCVAAAGIVLDRMTAPLPPGTVAARRNIRTWSAFALPFAFQSMQQFVSSGLGIDIVLVGVLASLSESGIYAAAFRFTPLLTLVRVAMDYAFGPKVSLLYGKSDLAAIELLYRASSRLGLAVTLPLGIILALWSSVFMTTFFGESYAGGAAALAWLVVGCVADSATGCNTTLLAMVGKPWLVFTNGLAGGLLTIVLCVQLIPQFGIAGAAFSVTVARVCVNGLATIELWKLEHVQPFTKDIWRLVVPSVCSLAMGLFLKNQYSSRLQGGVITLAIASAALLTIYVIGLRVAGMKWSQLV
ncbi:MAG: oligosaccharide flippase family protein [Candidatus Korobacteraceae bacterium]